MNVCAYGSHKEYLRFYTYLLRVSFQRQVSKGMQTVILGITVFHQFM